MGRKNRIRIKVWARVYRTRIEYGLEWCRKCGVNHADTKAPAWARKLTFGHLIPQASGGRFTFTNVTILCAFCNQKQGCNIWPELISLFDEEMLAPANRRWVLSRCRQWHIDNWEKMAKL